MNLPVKKETKLPAAPKAAPGEAQAAAAKAA